ncbi:MBL fold metallo-hydrolase [Lysobacter sp. HA35]
MIFRQLFDPVSSTYTYLVGCAETGEAVLIDPVLPQWQRDLQLLRSLGLRLAMTIDTHIHADHITSALTLKHETGSRMAFPEMDTLPLTDVPLVDGEPLQIGSLRLQPIHTPGHTDSHFAIASGDRVFTGDALLIDGCGRTDFQNGDAHVLYASVHNKLFPLGDDVLVYPAHDYQGRRVSSIGQERARNPRLGGERSVDEFVAIMAGLNLPYPKFIDYAVPGNRACGVCPPDIPDELSAYWRVAEPAPVI